MRVRRGEQQRAEYDPYEAAEITLEHAVKKKSKQKLLNHRCNCHCEHDDETPLLNRARAAEELDDVLLARAAPKEPLRDCVAQYDQRISEKQENRPSAENSNKTDSETAERAHVNTAELKKAYDKKHHERHEKKILQKISAAKFDHWAGDRCANVEQQKKDQYCCKYCLGYSERSPSPMLLETI